MHRNINEKITMTEINKTKVKNLSLLELIRAFVCSHLFLEKRPVRVTFPPVVGDFVFVKKIMEERTHNNMQFAIYKRNGELCFAKMIGINKNSLENYWFRNEVLTMMALTSAHSKMTKNNDWDISIPQGLSFYEDDEKLLAFFSYIADATTLDESNLTLNEKVEIMEIVNNYVGIISSLLMNGELKHMSKRPPLYYALTFCPAALKAIIRFPKHIRGILTLVAKFLISAKFILSRHDLVFVHRDINPSNIMISKSNNKKIYVIDFESSVLAHSMVQVAGIMIAGGRRGRMIEVLDKTETMKKIYQNKETASIYTFFATYACVYSLAATPSYRFDYTFNYMNYCLKL